MANELNEVYDHIAKAYGLRLKAQLPGSGLCFDRLLDVQDALTGERFRLLRVAGVVLRFADRAQLIAKLIKHIERLEGELAAELASLERHEQEDLVIDEYAMYNAKESLAVRESKLCQVKKRLMALQATE